MSSLLEVAIYVTSTRGGFILSHNKPKLEHAVPFTYVPWKKLVDTYESPTDKQTPEVFAEGQLMEMADKMTAALVSTNPNLANQNYQIVVDDATWATKPLFCDLTHEPVGGHTAWKIQYEDDLVDVAMRYSVRGFTIGDKQPKPKF